MNSEKSVRSAPKSVKTQRRKDRRFQIISIVFLAIVAFFQTFPFWIKLIDATHSPEFLPEIGKVYIWFADFKMCIRDSSSSTAGEYALRGKANTGDLTVYFRVTVEEYTELTGITANLPESEEEGYDYYFKTAKGTSWNMTDGMAGRGEALLNGSVMGGAQAPLNLTYYASLYKMTFTPRCV